MRVGITSKLFFGLLGTSIVVAIAMGLATHVSFTRGFLGYLNHQEIQKAERLIPTLAKAYQEHGSWEFIRGERRAWFNILRSSELAPVDGVPPEEYLIGLNVRLGLLDEERRPVTGAPESVIANATLRPIEVNQQVVGYVAVLPFQQVSTAAAIQFEQQQRKSILIIGGLAILLAVIVAVALAQILLAPVRRITQATHRLAAGEYDSEIKINSRDELGQLAEDFNRLAVTLKKNEQLRRDFMADMSHELRTPLAILRGELEALEDGVRPLSAASINSLQSEVTNLGKLVDDLYDLSLSDMGALTYRKRVLDVRDPIEMVLESYADRLAAQKIDVLLKMGNAPLDILADQDRLRQLFTNLVENVLRYTDAGGRLTILARRENGQIVIDMQDSEPGVPTDLLPHLFERLYRVESSRNRASGGSGLGLAICRKILDAHGGSIDAKSSPLGGLWIALHFPEYQD